jgi:D-alanine--poly(phosphoribitol) ligase subunit 1
MNESSCEVSKTIAATFGEQPQLRAADGMVHAAFEANAAENPDRVALVVGGTVWSYRELNLQANKLAHALRGRGVRPGCVVGVCLHPSPQLVASILAILKAGAAYCPLDATYPHDRLAVMISQLNEPRHVIVAEQTQPLLQASLANMLDVDELCAQLPRAASANPVLQCNSSDLCYVVFTSGTTGIPKATAIRHSGWWNLLCWLEREYRLTSSSSDLLVSAFGFDISQRSIMTPLFTGATLHMLPSCVFDPAMARRCIAQYRIRTIHCAPSTLYLLVEPGGPDDGALDSLEYIFIGGEALTVRRVVAWASRPGRQCKLVHQYGVAECTDIASSHVMTDFAQYLESGVPIGKPVDNCGVLVLNPDLSPVGAGEVGEICISGAGVGVGYLNNDALNRERFVWMKGEYGQSHIYRTGDLGRLRSDGSILCLGRMDNQVKVRGIRVDLGEIEAALRTDPEISDAVVLAIGNEAVGVDTTLVAFVIPAEANGVDRFDERRLRLDAAKRLPRQLVPRHFVAIEAFPMTHNGKCDRPELARRYKAGRVSAYPAADKSGGPSERHVAGPASTH